MDEGPFRAPQPVERRVPSRDTTPRQPAEKPEPVKEAVHQTSRRAERVEIPSFDDSKRRRPLGRILVFIAIIIALLGIGLAGYTAFSKAQAGAVTGIDTSKYQAVFFNNGEVYFGKLQSVNDKYMKLTDIFYLHSNATASSANSTTQDNSADSTDAQLIKLGNEAYGPEDAMIISRDQVSRYMNLKPDSKVVQLIDKYTAK